MVFTLKLEIKKYVSGEYYHRSESFFNGAITQIETIRSDLELKEDALLNVDETRIEELRLNHREFLALADQLLLSLKKGLNNRGYVESCALIELFVEHVTRFDTKVFSVNEIISSLDPYSVQEFNKLISFSPVPNVFLLQVKLMKNIIDFNVILTRYADDFFTIEEKYNHLLVVLSRLLQAEVSFVDRFYDQDFVDDFKSKQNAVRQAFRDVADQIIRRDLPTLDDFLSKCLAKVIEYINRDSYRVIRPDKIKLSFLENIDSFEEIGELFEGTQEYKEVGAIYNEFCALFKSEAGRFEILLDDVISQFNKDSSLIEKLNLNSIFAEELQKDLRKLREKFYDDEGISPEKGRVLYKVTKILIEGQCGRIQNLL